MLFAFGEKVELGGVFRLRIVEAVVERSNNAELREAFVAIAKPGVKVEIGFGVS